MSIPGSEESISHITPELLYTCHRAFYSPKNMALVVCGTADFEQVCRMAEEISPKDAPEIVSVITASAARKSISRL